MASPSPPPTASSTSSSPHRKLLHSLIYWAVQRCRVSESPCRFTVSIKRSPEPARSSPLRISVSDTGVGSKLEEFLELDALARDTPVEKWETTPMSYLWKNLACELFIEQTDSAGSGNVCMSQGSDDVHLPITTSSIDRLVSGLKDYALSHGNASDRCEACYMNRDCLKIGTGAVNNVDRRKAKGQFVEVVIMIAHTSSDLSCWISNCSSTQVLHFEDFIPCPISQSSFNVLMSIDWQSYGFKLKGGFMDDDGNAVLQWDNIRFARVDIAIHTYHGGAVNEWKISQPERHLVRKALKSALLGLKVDHAEDFLSCHGQKVREYVPDLAESIAGLILSSSDQEFQDECIALLGLGSDQDLTEGSVRSCIGEKMNRIIEMNDTKDNVEHNSPYLFECEKIDEDSQLDEDDADQDMILDF